MSTWNSSSLVANDNPKKRKGLLSRPSKQDKMSKKMFGRSKSGKNPQIGKKFKSKGRGVGDKSSKKVSMIGPSDEEFDDMMESTVTNNPNKKKSSITKKFFG